MFWRTPDGNYHVEVMRCELLHRAKSIRDPAGQSLAWLAIAVTLHRTTERGTELFPEEAMTREQAIRLYTINNA
jgi:hypothetical protein